MSPCLQKRIHTLLIACASLLLPCQSHAVFSQDVNQCITDPQGNSQPLKYTRLKCYYLDSLNGVERLTNLKYMHFYKNRAFLTADADIVAPSVETLELDFFSDWRDETQMKTIARVFPNVRHIRCNNCNLDKLAYLAHFKKLNSIYIDGSIERKVGIGPPDERDLDGLDYNKVGLSIRVLIDTNIKCRTLGIWQHRIHQSDAEIPSNYQHVKPYRAGSTCFPELHQQIIKITEADKLYKQGNIDKAHQLYHDAFHINPYNPRAISSLALTYYRTGEICKSAQVAHSGTVLPVRGKSTQASIWYNYYLALEKLGLHKQARQALQKSIEIRPTKSKSVELENLSGDDTGAVNCPLTNNWINKLYVDIEAAAVQLSRSGVVNDECYQVGRNPRNVDCRRGKGGPCYRVAYSHARRCY